MILLIKQDRPADQKHNALYFISGNQLFKLTAHDMKSALVNGKLEKHGSQKYSSKRVKVIKPKPTDTPSKVPIAIQTSGNNPTDTPITVPTTIQTFVIKKGIKPDEPPQNVATSHLKDTYAKENDLLHMDGRKRFRNLAKRDKILTRAVMQSKIRQVRRSNKYMFGYLIPKSYKDA